MRYTGIIPAGGKAERFTGTIKELLPVAYNSVVLDYTVRAMIHAGVTEIIVLAATHKAQAYAQYCTKHYEKALRVVFIGSEHVELWDALSWSFKTLVHDSQWVSIGLADTVVPLHAYERKEPINLGTFATNEAHRFSVVEGNRIVTKSHRFTDAPMRAWGTITLSEHVVHYINGNKYTHYDEALTDAMQNYQTNVFWLTHYDDLGDIEHYARFISERNI